MQTDDAVNCRQVIVVKLRGTTRRGRRRPRRHTCFPRFNWRIIRPSRWCPRQAIVWPDPPAVSKYLASSFICEHEWVCLFQFVLLRRLITIGVREAEFGDMGEERTLFGVDHVFVGVGSDYDWLIFHSSAWNRIISIQHSTASRVNANSDLKTGSGINLLKDKS